MGDRSREGYRPITSRGLSKFHGRVADIDFSFISSNASDTDDKFSLFVEKMCSAMKYSFDERIRPPLTGIQSKSMWFNETIRNLRSELHLLTDLHKNHPQLVTRRDLNMHKKYYREAILTSKKNANIGYIKQSQNTQRAMWTIIKCNNTVNHIVGRRYKSRR